MLPSSTCTHGKASHVSFLISHLFVATTFFSFGTAMMDYFLVYPSRAIVGASEFVSYHALLEERILPISVAPFALLTFLNIIMLWLRPTQVSKLAVWASLCCVILDWVENSVKLTTSIRFKLTTCSG